MTEQTNEQIIANLQSRIDTLESTLIATNDALTNIQRSIVELTADHIQRIFNDDVLVDSIAHRIMVAGANAISHKAKSSKQRAPELVVIEGYIPGAIRVTLTDNGALIEEQTEDGKWLSGADLSEEMRQPHVQTVFGDLVVSYGAELGRPYYVVESTHLEEFRRQTAAKAMEVTRSVEEATHHERYNLTTEAESADGFLPPRDMVEVTSTQLFTVVRDGNVLELTAADLKPGDQIEITRDGVVCRESLVSIQGI